MRESVRRGWGRELRGMTYGYIRYARAGIVSPSSLLHSSQGLSGNKGGSWYSRLRSVEFDTDSLLACSLVDGDEEPEERLRLLC